MESSFSNEQIQIDDLPQFQSVEYHRVESKLMLKSLVQSGLVLCLLLGLIGWNYFFNDSEQSVYYLGVLPIGFILFWVIDIIIRQKHYGYVLREKDILYRKGYIFNKTTIVPYNRIQHIAVNRSFLDQLFGIASLNIFTAGGTGSDVRITGLTPEIAENINELLSQKIFNNE